MGHHTKPKAGDIGCTCCDHRHNERQEKHNHDHDHGHDHNHDMQASHDPTQQRMASRRWLGKIVAAGLLLAAAIVAAPEEGWLRLLCFLPSYAVVGWDVLYGAVRGLLRARLLDERVLMAVATMGALALGEYPEAVLVMLLYQLGEWFQEQAVGRSRRSIAALMNIRPEEARLRRGADFVIVHPEAVAVGECIQVRAGERIPLDGTVIEGEANIDTSALTGESLPRLASAGTAVYGGTVNLDGTLLLRVIQPFGESAVSRILKMTEHSALKKAKTERFVSRFARIYTPVVVLAALLLAVVPPLALGDEFSVWIYRALTFLVISCPCALVISVPLSYFGGIGGASRLGILIKGGASMDALAKVRTMVFDKTGTLTKGELRLAESRALSGDERALLETAALAESQSTHPLARSVRAAWKEQTDTSRVTELREVTGKGIMARIDGEAVLVGSWEWLCAQSFAPEEVSGTVLHVAKDGVLLGWLRMADEARPEAAETLKELRRLGVRHTVMLSGDAASEARRVGAAVNLDEVHAGLSPEDKLRLLEEKLAAMAGRGTLCYVGDGINDAPVLARADVGVAMGALGTDAAMEAADVVLMEDKISKLAAAVRLSRRTVGIVRQNIAFALGVKAVFLVLGALGLADMWGAVFADVGVSALAVGNALRALRVSKGGRSCRPY